MSSGKTDYLEDALLNHVLRGQAFTPPTSLWLALQISESNDASSGTEVTAEDYARQQITFSAPSSGNIANSNVITFGIPASNWGTLVSVGIFDAQTSGNLLYYGSVTARNMDEGLIIELQIGDVIIIEN